jgi:hypothetical protein
LHSCPETAGDAETIKTDGQRQESERRAEYMKRNTGRDIKERDGQSKRGQGGARETYFVFPNPDLSPILPKFVSNYLSDPLFNVRRAVAVPQISLRRLSMKYCILIF